VAYEFPKVNVVGIDISNQLVDYADAQARVRWQGNASFQVMDILKPLEFDGIYQQMLNEMSTDGFCAAWFYLTVAGAKPE
jgi:tRNA G46 methylase TrmB